MSEKLLPCPFCGANPHHGLTKVMHCQLHGDPYQNFRIWCPHKCAQVECGNEPNAAKKWNTRAAMQADAAPGWVVGNGNGDRWRAWKNGNPVWVEDREKATRYARREDAEAVHEDDEDAWRIVPYQPVADRVSTSSPVADRETGNTSDKDLIADAISDSLGPDWTTFDAAHHVMQRLTDEGLCITQAPARGTDCPASHDGFHHVDTSMESGPNNCFHCERLI